jgi:mRNA interferase MazF
MTNYSYGDIVLVPFPFTDQSAIKKRPAVIVSSDTYNSKRPDNYHGRHKPDAICELLW